MILLLLILAGILLTAIVRGCVLLFYLLLGALTGIVLSLPEGWDATRDFCRYQLNRYEWRRAGLALLHPCREARLWDRIRRLNECDVRAREYARVFEKDRSDAYAAKAWRSSARYGRARRRMLRLLYGVSAWHPHPYADPTEYAAARQVYPPYTAEDVDAVAR